MWQQRTDQEIGDRLHRVIQAACAPGGDLRPALQSVLAERPVYGVRAASVRMRVASASGTYLRRFKPHAELVGIEATLGGGVADLVWCHDGMFVVDELKSGSVDLTSSDLIAQVTRLVVGGRDRWGDCFAGVRLVPLSRPTQCCVVVASNDAQLVTADLPAWLGVRS